MRTSSSASARFPASTVGGQGSQQPHGPTIAIVTGAEQKNGAINPVNTCRGRNRQPEISWKPLNGTTGAEQLILVRTLIHGQQRVTNFAMAGLPPTMNYLEAETIPKGAVLGRNSFGTLKYDVCPPEIPAHASPRSGGLITFAVYALPQKLHLKPGFDPESLKPYLEEPGTAWGSVVLFTHGFPNSHAVINTPGG
ncbi:MAG TPA: hypothetical protein VKU89_08550 [Solirubrobacteraceae bacterium]|nr:hypothetical protein [Solirubrobacteraceae bacterium]